MESILNSLCVRSRLIQLSLRAGSLWQGHAEHELLSVPGPLAWVSVVSQESQQRGSLETTSSSEIV